MQRIKFHGHRANWEGFGVTALNTATKEVENTTAIAHGYRMVVYVADNYNKRTHELVGETSAEDLKNILANAFEKPYVLKVGKDIIGYGFIRARRGRRKLYKGTITFNVTLPFAVKAHSLAEAEKLFVKEGIVDSSVANVLCGGKPGDCVYASHEITDVVRR